MICSRIKKEFEEPSVWKVHKSSNISVLVTLSNNTQHCYRSNACRVDDEKNTQDEVNSFATGS
jgi:hypothetical protein